MSSLREINTDVRSWMKEFMDLKGLVVMSNYLNTLTHRRSKSGADVEMELELLKCLRTSMSTKVSDSAHGSYLTVRLGSKKLSGSPRSSTPSHSRSCLRSLRVARSLARSS